LFWSLFDRAFCSVTSPMPETIIAQPPAAA
jgi:hypothetical protein